MHTNRAKTQMKVKRILTWPYHVRAIEIVQPFPHCAWQCGNCMGFVLCAYYARCMGSCSIQETFIMSVHGVQFIAKYVNRFSLSGIRIYAAAVDTVQHNRNFGHILLSKLVTNQCASCTFRWSFARRSVVHDFRYAPFIMMRVHSYEHIYDAYR